MFVCCFLSVTWIKINTSPVCFGARNDSYGVFTIPRAGHVIAFKLVYLSGYVNCQVSDPQYNSKWGCPVIQPPDPNIGVFITDEQQQRILPTDNASFYDIPCHAKFFYGVPGYSSESPELGFNNFSSPLAVSLGQKLQIWFTEDLYNCYEKDNAGKTCTDVYGLYV